MLSDEKPEVRELRLTKLGSKTAEIKLTLTDSSLLVEATDDAPLPDWLQGEIPFDDLDLAYVDPSVELEGEGAEEEPLPPGFRIARWVEITDEETNESFPRLATMALDGEHVDLALAEGFAATFARLAGREKPEEVPVEEAPAEEPVEALPTGAPEAATAEEPGKEEAPAFEAAADEAPAFAPAESEPDDSPAFAAPDDEDDDSPAFAAADDDETT